LELHLVNCFERLVDVLPNLEYRLHNDAEIPSTTKIVVIPEDYLTRTQDPNVCILEIECIQSFVDPLNLSDKIIRRIGGIHFDYAQNRIGVFDSI
jgi:hypothetical protein